MTRRADLLGRGVLLCVSLLLSACAVGPDFHRPPAPSVAGLTATELPQETMGGDTAQDRPQRFIYLVHPDEQWWTAFGSRAIDFLVEQALTNNPSIGAAEAALFAGERAGCSTTERVAAEPASKLSADAWSRRRFSLIAIGVERLGLHVAHGTAQRQLRRRSFRKQPTPGRSGRCAGRKPASAVARSAHQLSRQRCQRRGAGGIASGVAGNHRTNRLSQCATTGPAARAKASGRRARCRGVRAGSTAKAERSQRSVVEKAARATAGPVGSLGGNAARRVCVRATGPLGTAATRHSTGGSRCTGRSSTGRPRGGERRCMLPTRK